MTEHRHPASRVIAGHHEEDDDEDRGERDRHDPAVQRGWPAAKGEDEAQEVYGQRQDPEEGNGRDVGGHIRGRAEQQTRRHEGQRDPVEASARARRVVRDRRRRRGDRLRQGFAGPPGDRGPRHPPPDRERAQGNQAGEEQIAEAPEPRLGEPTRISQVQSRLDQRRIAQEREHAAEIARRVEEVGIERGRVSRVSEPALQERRGRAHHEEGQADREGKQDQHAQHGIRPGSRQACGVDAEGQEGEGRGQHGQVQDGLTRDAEPGGARVRIGVSGEQGRLEEEHTGAPHGRRAPEERQDHLADHGLHHEQERGAHEQRARVEDDDECQTGSPPPIVSPRPRSPIARAPSGTGAAGPAS